MLKNRILSFTALPSLYYNNIGVLLAIVPVQKIPLLWRLVLDIPTPSAFGLFQDPATLILVVMTEFHLELCYILLLILAFSFAMLSQIIHQYGIHEESKVMFIQPRFNHHTALELIWTLIPMYILYVIAAPSFVLLYDIDVVKDPLMTLKVIGRQWYWHYEYSDYLPSSIVFDAFMVPDQESNLRLLETTLDTILPIDVEIRVLITSSDVIHSWAIPSFGLKLDACPGRLNQIALMIYREGLYYGQCSEICGINHGFMPISVLAVFWAKFVAFLEAALPHAAATVPESEPATIVATAEPVVASAVPTPVATSVPTPEPISADWPSPEDVAFCKQFPDTILKDIWSKIERGEKLQVVERLFFQKCAFVDVKPCSVNDSCLAEPIQMPARLSDEQVSKIIAILKEHCANPNHDASTCEYRNKTFMDVVNDVANSNN